MYQNVILTNHFHGRIRSKLTISPCYQKYLELLLGHRSPWFTSFWQGHSNSWNGLQDDHSSWTTNHWELFCTEDFGHLEQHRSRGSENHEAKPFWKQKIFGFETSTNNNWKIIREADLNRNSPFLHTIKNTFYHYRIIRLGITKHWDSCTDLN